MQNITSLLIKPAGPDCNICCEYCFYSSKKGMFESMPVHRMSIETMNLVVSQYLELAGNNASLGFQGGEPTLCGIEFFREVFKSVKKHKRPNQTVSIALQTNGILLNHDWAHLLRKNNVLVGLSLDGPADIHDAHRRTFNDEDTHHIVTKNMEILKEVGVEFNTLTVITKANVNRGKELVDYFLNNASGYMQFIPCVEVIDNKIAHYTPTPIEYADFLIEVFDLWYNDGKPNFYVRLFDEMLISFVEYAPASCYFAPKCVANLVVEHNGSIYPCDFFVEDDWYLGNINKESLKKIVENPKLIQFINRKLDLDDKCKGCKWRCICCGDCIKYRYDIDGQKTKSAYFCEGYKKFFEYAAPKLSDLKRSLLNDNSLPKSVYWRKMEASIQRNKPCLCGSGVKYKKCCYPVKGI